VPKVTEEHRKGRRREILGAALRCFARKGFHATSMSDIIAESGLSAGAIYGHYASKDDLIRGVAADVFSPVLSELRSAPALPEQPVHPVDFATRLLEGLVAAVGNTAILVQVWGEAAVDASVRELFDTVYAQVLELNRQHVSNWLSATARMPVEAIEEQSLQLARLLTGLAQGGIVQTAFVDGFDVRGYLQAARPLFD